MYEHEPELGALLRHRGSQSISIYLPLSPVPGGRPANRIRLKNALRKARTALRAAGHEPQLALLEAAAAKALGAPDGRGLVALACRDQVYVRVLPAPVPERVLVGDRFLLRPLIEAAEHSRPFHVLVIQRGAVRLYRGTIDRLTKVLLPDDVPRRLGDTTPESPDERRLQAHSTSSCGRAPAIHGQGLGERRGDHDLYRFVQALDDSLRPLLTGVSSLVLCGEPKLLGVFRNLSVHAHLIELEVPGCFDHEPLRSLRTRVADGVIERRRRYRQAAVGNLHALPWSDKLRVKMDLVVPAADRGRVDTLFVAHGQRCWGHYDRQAHAVTRVSEPQPSSQDLLDLAAVRTLEHGGRVLTVDAGTLPGDAKAAAVLRY